MISIGCGSQGDNTSFKVYTPSATNPPQIDRLDPHASYNSGGTLTIYGQNLFACIWKVNDITCQIITKNQSSNQDVIQIIIPQETPSGRNILKAINGIWEIDLDLYIY